MTFQIASLFSLIRLRGNFFNVIGSALLVCLHPSLKIFLHIIVINIPTNSEAYLLLIIVVENT